MDRKDRMGPRTPVSATSTRPELLSVGPRPSVQLISARLMPVWDVENTSQFDDWYQTLSEEDQDAVIARVELPE
jgi:hypothetical protein